VADGFEAYAAGLLAAVNIHMRSRLTIIEGRRSWNYKIVLASDTRNAYLTDQEDRAII
jgi:hypothetical protein